jgi:hypothetical protein
MGLRQSHDLGNHACSAFSSPEHASGHQPDIPALPAADHATMPRPWGSRGRCRTACPGLKVPLTYRSIRLPRFRRRALSRKWTSRSSEFHSALASLPSRLAFGQTLAARCRVWQAATARRFTSSRPRCFLALPMATYRSVPGNIERSYEAIERYLGLSATRWRLRSFSEAVTRYRCRTCGRCDSYTDAKDKYYGERYRHGTWDATCDRT